MKKINVGIIGCGQIAKTRHVKELSGNPDARLAAFCDSVRERAEDMRRLYGGDVYTDYRELLARKDLHAVFVLCGNNLHGPVSVAALNAGLHVMCEKPMASSLELCGAMMAAAKKNGRNLMVGYNQRMLPAHVKTRELIRSGLYGKVITFRTTFGHRGCEYFSLDGSSTWFFKKDAAGFGASADLGIHKVDLLRFLLDEEIVQVISMAGTLAKKDDRGIPIEVDDNLLCLIKTESGRMGSLTASWTYAGEEDNSTAIYLEKAVIHVFEHGKYDIRIAEEDGGVKTYRLGGIQTNDNQIHSGISDEFIASILEGRRPAISGEDGMRAVAVILACLESSEKEQAVNVSYEVVK